MPFVSTHIFSTASLRMSALSNFAATVAFNASALYWKDWDNTGNLANPANWNDKGSQPGEVNSLPSHRQMLIV
jgi:hypothetical protein